MNSQEYYRQLITSEHRDHPLFEAVVGALTSPMVDRSASELPLIPAFNLDGATGAQLDAVGLWVGVTRNLKTPLVGVYFSWDATAALGWDSGSWKGPFDADSGLLSLPDDVYRRLLRARIAANYWDGTIPGATAVWSSVFDGNQSIVIQDNQDMTMLVGFVGGIISAIDQALLTGGYLPLKPAGVRIVAYAVPVDTNPLFAWDISLPGFLVDGSGNRLTDVDGNYLTGFIETGAPQGTDLAGWDLGSWALEISPT